LLGGVLQPRQLLGADDLELDEGLSHRATRRELPLRRLSDLFVRDELVVKRDATKDRVFLLHAR
jgi:hypothetical protein